MVLQIAGVFLFGMCIFLDVNKLNAGSLLLLTLDLNSGIGIVLGRKLLNCKLLLLLFLNLVKFHQYLYFLSLGLLFK